MSRAGEYMSEDASIPAESTESESGSESESKSGPDHVETESFQRRSPWKAAASALSYIQAASRADKVQIRTSDRVTIIALLIASILEVLSLVYTPMASMRLAFVVLLDLVLGGALLMFVVYRLGILSSMNHRQAIISWQLMLGCLFAGIFICINSAVGIAFIVSSIKADSF